MKKAKFYKLLTKMIRILFGILNIILIIFIVRQLYYGIIEFREKSHHPIGVDEVEYSINTIPAKTYDIVPQRQDNGLYKTKIDKYTVMLTEDEVNALNGQNQITTELYRLEYKCKNPIIFKTITFINIPALGQGQFEDLSTYDNYVYNTYTKQLYDMLFFSEADTFWAEEPNNLSR